MNERIVIDPKICHGQACIKGTRIPVSQILGMLSNGDRIEELLEEYPSLTRQDILACLRPLSSDVHSLGTDRVDTKRSS